MEQIIIRLQQHIRMAQILRVDIAEIRQMKNVKLNKRIFIAKHKLIPLVWINIKDYCKYKSPLSAMANDYLIKDFKFHTPQPGETSQGLYAQNLEELTVAYKLNCK